MEPRALSHPARLAGQSLLRLQSDARLTELARAGHEPAFAAIVHRYRPALLGYCARILGPERAEDAVQQALASTHQAMISGDDRPLRLRPWLYRIAHNAALNVLRARRDEAELSDAAVAGGAGPDEALAQRERLEEILAAIATLPPAQRDALLLRELEGRSHEEIAGALGVSSGAARAVIFRARAAVRAACTALTPSPLVMRMAEVAGTSGGEHATGAVAKTAAGLLAACAVIGGATSGIVERRGGEAPVPRADAGSRHAGGEAGGGDAERAPASAPAAGVRPAAVAVAGGSAPPPRGDGSAPPPQRRVAALVGIGALAGRDDGDRRERRERREAGGATARPDRAQGAPAGGAPSAPAAAGAPDDRGEPRGRRTAARAGGTRGPWRAAPAPRGGDAAGADRADRGRGDAAPGAASRAPWRGGRPGRDDAAGGADHRGRGGEERPTAATPTPTPPAAGRGHAHGRDRPPGGAPPRGRDEDGAAAAPAPAPADVEPPSER